GGRRCEPEAENDGSVDCSTHSALRVLTQNITFNANCSCRIGTVALVSLMVPNAPPPGVGMRCAPATFQLLCARFVFGARKFGWFSRLNASIRNCTFVGARWRFLTAD